MVAGEAILDPAIVADGASKLFLDGAVVAFHQLSLAVKRNEIMCIVGPSGCGKTTLLRCIAGLTDLTGRPTQGRRQTGCGTVPWSHPCHCSIGPTDKRQSQTFGDPIPRSNGFLSKDNRRPCVAFV